MRFSRQANGEATEYTNNHRKTYDAAIGVSGIPAFDVKVDLAGGPKQRQPRTLGKEQQHHSTQQSNSSSSSSSSRTGKLGQSLHA